jgi:hypothetical protein
MRTAVAPSTTVEKNGVGVSVRPISSRRIPSSRNENPAPPCSSGMCIACHPMSAMAFHMVGSNPDSVSISSRTFVDGDLSVR